MLFKRLSLLILLALGIIFIFPFKVEASATVQTRYLETFTLKDNQDVFVNKQIELTNTQDSLYVSQYQIVFSNFARIKDLVILEDNQAAVFTKDSHQSQTQIVIEFQQPAIGFRATKTLTIQYTLINYLLSSGVHSELLIPVSKTSTNETVLDYQVLVKTPLDYPNLGISKPRVQELDQHSFQWTNVHNSNVNALYLAFSDKAYYRVDFFYTLVNNAPYPQLLYAALVPDGTYQKSYLDKIEPEPEQTIIDEDGNFLAGFKVGPKSVLRVKYSGFVELFAKPRVEMSAYQQVFLPLLYTRYLTQERYWSLDLSRFADLDLDKANSSLAIYDYVVNKLEYDTTRLNQDLKRQGAQWAISNPSQAVCMEYTDLYVALTREKGIPSRAVVGYGLTADDQLLPLSFLGDVLHAWPEYFDQARQLWLPIDPTWADTAGIDYFRSFDLSHIAFVYHGKNPDSPLPPGVYKLNPQDKDIVVTPVNTVPGPKSDWEITWPKRLLFNADKDNQLNLVIKANSNIINYQVNLTVLDRKTKKQLAFKKLKVVVPLSKQTLRLNLDKTKLKLGNKQTLELAINNQPVSDKEYTVLPQTVYWLQTNGFWLVLVSALIIGFILKKWRS